MHPLPPKCLPHSCSAHSLWHGHLQMIPAETNKVVAKGAEGFHLPARGELLRLCPPGEGTKPLFPCDKTTKGICLGQHVFNFTDWDFPKLLSYKICGRDNSGRNKQTCHPGKTPRWKNPSISNASDCKLLGTGQSLTWLGSSMPGCAWRLAGWGTRCLFLEP